MNPEELEGRDNKGDQARFADDLLALHKDLDKINFIKDATGNTGQRSYKYQALPELAALVKPVLRKHNFVWITRPGIADGEPVLGYTLLHLSGNQVGGEMLLMSKGLTPQDQGSAITYARRYSLSATLDIVADEDDDGAKAQEASTKPIENVTKNNILAVLTALGKDADEYEKAIGMPIDKLTNAQGNEKIAELKLILQRKRNKEVGGVEA